MTKVAIAGGTSSVDRELIDALLATNRHDLLIFSRQATPTDPDLHAPRITWVQTDYTSTPALAQALASEKVHTLLSFIIDGTVDGDSPIQKRLIDACIQAGMKRFAPSEWASSGLSQMPWYTYKASIRTYLSALNAPNKVLEYTLFQPGLFTEYISHPYKSSKHAEPLHFPIGFHNKRAIIVTGSERARITLTSVADFCDVVIKAPEYEKEWPAVSGIAGETIPFGDLIGIGERVRGAEFNVETVSKESFLDDTWVTSWTPRNEHPSIPKEMVEEFARPSTKSICLAFAEGEWAVSQEWNGILEKEGDGFVFTRADEWLKGFWEGRE